MNSKINMNVKSKRPNKRLSIMGILILSALVLVSLSLPPIISLSAQANQLQVPDPQFNLDATYAYVGQGPNETYTNSKGIALSAVSQYPSVVYFNITRLSNAETISYDAIIEVYNVKIASDKGPDENFVFFTGTNYNPSFSEAELMTLTIGIYDLFDVNTIDGVTGHFRFNWSNGESVLSKKVGSFGTYDNSYRNRLGLWSAGEPNTISVTVQRVGCVTITNGAVTIQPDMISGNNRTQVQLQKYGNSFLDNKIIPTDKLPQTILFHPLG